MRAVFRAASSLAQDTWGSSVSAGSSACSTKPWVRFIAAWKVCFPLASWKPSSSMSGDSWTAFPLDIGIRDVRVGVYVCRVLGCWLLLSVMMLLTVICVVVVLSVAVWGILFIVVATGVLLASVGGVVSVISAELFVIRGTCSCCGLFVTLGFWLRRQMYYRLL